MPTSFRLRLECEGLGRGRAGELDFFEEDARVVEGQAAVLKVSLSRGTVMVVLSNPRASRNPIEVEC